MDDIGINPGRIEIGTPPHCSEDRNEILGTVEGRRVQPKPADLKMWFIQSLIAERSDIHVHDLGQFAAEVLDMHTGSSVGRRRILIREEQSLHG
jgi:hypothetical protein